MKWNRLAKLLYSGGATVLAGMFIYVFFSSDPVQELFYRFLPYEFDLLFPLLLFSIFLGLLFALPVYFYFFHDRINLSGAMIGAGAGLFIITIVRFIINGSAMYGNASDEMLAIYDWLVFLPLATMIAGFFVIKTKKNPQMHWVVFGMGTGILISYVGTLGIRYVNNSLTSLFYFSATEWLYVAIGTLLIVICTYLLTHMLIKNDAKNNKLLV
ncbi:hypothetical protein [Jeotgalibacillus proteolyticus]|uniref:Uncharacterized protein n=1 Tax=Jeotgalibacillus proteolyticus TaxID=2082395 RepID=A0A2S5GBI5_9BACL|nr:hypothetical protein [Jeotgalibacillus proteolyticus]PPA70281.1 hypothetical protein C4B60_11925 [Jeotgalibacillus proteolyticus]